MDELCNMIEDGFYETLFPEDIGFYDVEPLAEGEGLVIMLSKKA